MSSCLFISSSSFFVFVFVLFLFFVCLFVCFASLPYKFIFFLIHQLVLRRLLVLFDSPATGDDGGRKLCFRNRRCDYEL